jgi:flagellar basal body-associated protein FliL
MKNKYRKPDWLTISLLAVAALIVLVIVTGTAWALATGRVRSLSSEDLRDADLESIRTGAADGMAIFADVGVLRARTADKEMVVIVISPLFPYPSADIAFREELVSKNRAIRVAVLDWFSSHTLRELTGLGEERVKEALVTEMNELLVLGKITKVWFGEYMVLD